MVKQEKRHGEWSLEEVKFLRENYGKMPIKDIASQLNRSERSVYMKARKLGLCRPGKKGSERGSSIVECATCGKKFKVAWARLRMGYDNYYCSRKCADIGHRKRVDINNPLVAYLVGLIQGDGYIRDHKRKAVGFCNSNTILIEEFSKAAKSVGLKVCSYRRVRQNNKKRQVIDVYISSVCLYELIKKLSEKSALLKFVDISREHSIYWLKGIYEADGTLACFGRRCQLRIANTSEFIIATVEKCLSKLHFKYSKRHEILKSGKTLYIVTLLGGSAEIKKFLSVVKPCIKNKPSKEMKNEELKS